MVPMSSDLDPGVSPSDSGEAQRLVAEMAELAGGLAHELRNPLSTMMVNLKLLAEDLNDDRAHPEDTRRRALLKVGVLLREAQRLQVLFDRFLSVAGSYGLDWSEVDLNNLVASLVEFIEPSAKDSGVRIHLDLAPGELTLRADSALLRQALLNLLMNAQQAMPDGGDLRVTTVRDAHHVVISVADSGVGIPDEDKDRILRPFFSTKSEGGGLGLSITKRVVQEHGGSIEFETQWGVGTTFTIKLPLESAATGNARADADTGSN